MTRDAAWDEFSRIVSTRRSHKKPFLDAPVDPLDIETCITLATRAPSAHNAQPWRFITFFKGTEPDDTIRARVTGAMTARFAADLERDGVPREEATATGRASHERFSRAPVLVVAFLDRAVLDRYPDDGRARIEHLMGVQGVAACCTTFLLAVHAIGLHACWYCAPLFTPDVFREIANVPATWEPQAFITAGHGSSDVEPGEPRRDGRQPGTGRLPAGAVSFPAGHFLAGRDAGGGTP